MNGIQVFKRVISGVTLALFSGLLLYYDGADHFAWIAAIVFLVWLVTL